MQVIDWRKDFLYVESYKYVEVHVGVGSGLVCSSVGCDMFFCTIFSDADDMVALFGYPNRQAGVKTSSYVESYEYVEVYGGM